MSEVQGSRVLQLREGLTSAALDSAATEPEYVAILPNGSHYRLSARLQELVECIDGQRTLADVAGALSEKWRRPVRPEHVWDIAQRYLAPHGLLEDGTLKPPRAPERRIFAWHGRLLSAPQIVPIARLGQTLFAGPVVVAALAAAALLQAAASLKGPAIAAHFGASLGNGDFLLVYGLVLLSVLVHEFGHASACGRFGTAYGDIGIGLYLVFPVFYTDVTRIWRLSRRQRAVVDLGGVYFQLLVAGLYSGVYLATGSVLWLLAVVQIDFLVLMTLNPVVKFDGYWLVSDVLGIPNLGRRAREAASRLAGRSKATGFRPLPALIRAGLCGYLLVVIGGLGWMAWAVAVQAPHVGARFAQAVGTSLLMISQGWQVADGAAIAAGVVRLIAPVAIVASALLWLYRSITRWGRKVALKTRRHEVPLSVGLSDVRK
jgi:putative peptide zinc metalloprotease protein